jgi:tetratricopeptide (TPR) repeat protein
MSRKAKTHKAPVKPVSPHGMESVSLVAQADAAFAASRYKDAIELYKELIKRERRAAWVDGLASCYAGRAQELASKGMVKEALVLWRNRMQLCGKTLAEGPYFAWLLQAGEQGEMFRLLTDKTLSDAARAELETSLASTVLTATALPDLPADSALLRHRPSVLAALAAYHRGDFAVMEEQLQYIPFRSPYRDLKPALKALALLQTDAVAAQAAIARLPSNGPFERLVAVLRTSVLPNWLAALRDLDDDSRHLVLDIKGSPDTLRPLLLELAKLGETPAATALFDLLLRHRRVIPEDKFNNLFYRLMPHLGQRQFNSADFARLPEEKKVHILALAGDLKGVLDVAESNWIRMADFLSARPEQKLRAALIWRHVADLPGRDGMGIAAFDCLQKSLELDPEDRDSTLTVIRVLRADNNLSQARAYLDSALTIFPNDAGVLLEAVEVALAGKAFKKAVGLAKQVLALDPINPKVRGLIGHALFSHARKQIKARNFSAARKELDTAEEWLRAPTEFATQKLLRAFASEGSGPEVDALLREAVAGFGVSLMGAFHLLLEAEKTGLNPKALLLQSGVDLAPTPNHDAVVALAKRLNDGRGEENILRMALGPLRGPLKRAAREKFSEADYLLVCEALQRIGENELFSVFAEAALKYWPGRPVFVYLSAVSRYGNDPYEIPQREIHALDQAAKEARKQGDTRTASRISLLLAPPMDDMPFFDDEPFDSFSDLTDSPRAMFELLLAMQGEKALLDMVRQAIGKQAFTELKNQFGGNQKDFIHRLIDIMVEDVASIRHPPPSGFLPPPMPAPASPPPRNKKHLPPEIQKDLFDD